jgi:hypothetical protein
MKMRRGIEWVLILLLLAGNTIYGYDKDNKKTALVRIHNAGTGCQIASGVIIKVEQAVIYNQSIYKMRAGIQLTIAAPLKNIETLQNDFMDLKNGESLDKITIISNCPGIEIIDNHPAKRYVEPYETSNCVIINSGILYLGIYGAINNSITSYEIFKKKIEDNLENVKRIVDYYKSNNVKEYELCNTQSKIIAINESDKLKEIDCDGAEARIPTLYNPFYDNRLTEQLDDWYNGGGIVLVKNNVVKREVLFAIVVSCNYDSELISGKILESVYYNAFPENNERAEFFWEMLWQNRISSYQNELNWLTKLRNGLAVK